MQVVFSSVDESVDRVLLFDIQYFDETRRAIKEKTVEEVLKFVDSLKLKYDVTHVDISQPFYEIVIEIARKVKCEKKTEIYLTSKDTSIHLAFYCHPLVCRNIKIFDAKGRQIPNRLPDRVSEAQLEITTYRN